MAVVEGFLPLKKRYRYIEFLWEPRYNNIDNKEPCRKE